MGLMLRVAGYDPESLPAGGGLKDQVQVLSYVQTRGSVPVYWSEISNLHYVPKLQIRDIRNAVPAAKKHFDEQIRLYGDTYCVNLVNQGGREARVKTAYEQIVRALLTSPAEYRVASDVSAERFRDIESMKQKTLEDRIHYVYFDFHHECRKMQWHRAQLLLDQMAEALDKQRYFHATEGGSSAAIATVRNTQASVVRSNCMDCLDRTNVVQSMLAKWTLTRQLADIGVLDAGEALDVHKAFETMFRNSWADNADVVSRAYSGTGALKTDFTRTGVRTKNGALADLVNSCTRYVRNNFADGPRQDAYDLFLGTYLPYTSQIASSLVFVDRRPLFVQAVPYVAAASVFLVIFTLLVGEAGLVFRVLWASWALVAVYCGRFIVGHGMLYVNWPKLNTMAWASEGCNEAMGRVRKDVVGGRFVGTGGHERGTSAGGIRLVHLEEGKKRIE